MVAIAAPWLVQYNVPVLYIKIWTSCDGGAQFFALRGIFFRVAFKA